jgi:hypothetical protein
MEVEELKLYNKYQNIDIPHIEFIFIGIDKNNYYCFLYKKKNYNLSFLYLKRYGLNPNKIVKDSNLETYVNKYGDKCIKGCDYFWYEKEKIEKYLKPILKDKLDNITNR